MVSIQSMTGRGLCSLSGSSDISVAKKKKKVAPGVESIEKYGFLLENYSSSNFMKPEKICSLDTMYKS